MQSKIRCSFSSKKIFLPNPIPNSFQLQFSSFFSKKCLSNFCVFFFLFCLGLFTWGFLSSADMHLWVILESPQGSQSSCWVGACTCAVLLQPQTVAPGPTSQLLNWILLGPTQVPCPNQHSWARISLPEHMQAGTCLYSSPDRHSWAHKVICALT